MADLSINPNPEKAEMLDDDEVTEVILTGKGQINDNPREPLPMILLSNELPTSNDALQTEMNRHLNVVPFASSWIIHRSV